MISWDCSGDCFWLVIGRLHVDIALWQWEFYLSVWLAPAESPAAWRGV